MILKEWNQVSDLPKEHLFEKHRHQIKQIEFII